MGSIIIDYFQDFFVFIYIQMKEMKQRLNGENLNSFYGILLSLS